MLNQYYNPGMTGQLHLHILKLCVHGRQSVACQQSQPAVTHVPSKMFMSAAIKPV